ATVILDDLFEHIRRPVFVDGYEIFASASAGMSIFPEHGLDYGSLRHNADIAMYKVKGQERGGIAVFNIGMQQDAVLKMESEQRLRQAILDRHVCCAYQPKVNIRTQEVEGVETLIRLRNEEGVVQAPASFIDLAVELGLIDDLTHMVLEEIRGSIDVIDEMFGKGVRLSVNVAAKQATNDKFMAGFAEALSFTGFPERFMVEITEDAFISKSKFQAEIQPMLRAIGVGISIDDFGVGYSSLSALADITADELKIDRSFITDIHKRPRSQSILKAIESLGEALHMKVIAEGVETFEELAYLQAATRIKFAQGYYFSKPMFIEEFGIADFRQGTCSVTDPSRQTERRGSFGRVASSSRPNFRVR
ncbi:MAG: GGDEF domain-containing protein, partial [Oxalobacteraceae bacterium]